MFSETTFSKPVSPYSGVCPAGKMCPAGTSEPKDCTAGSYCEIGNNGTVDGACTAGYCFVTKACFEPVFLAVLLLFRIVA